MDNVMLKSLFTSPSQMEQVYDYRKLIKALKEYIEYTDKLVDGVCLDNHMSCAGVALSIVRTMVETLKAAYDNIVLGHISAANAINRSLLEKYICLKLIIENEDKELWKHWILQSGYISFWRVLKLKEDDPRWKMLDDVAEEFGLSKGYIKDHEKQLKKDYGWVCPIGGNGSFKSACECAGFKRYGDYQLLCHYTHGTSATAMLMPIILDESFLGSISVAFYYMHIAICECYAHLIDRKYERLSDKVNSGLSKALSYS